MTFKRLEGSIIEEHEIGMEEKQEPIEDNCDVTQDDKKSIAEGDIDEQNKFGTAEDIKEQKKSGTAEEEKMPVTDDTVVGAADTVQSNDATATTKPTPLPHTSN